MAGCYSTKNKLVIKKNQRMTSWWLKLFKPSKAAVEEKVERVLRYRYGVYHKIEETIPEDVFIVGYPKSGNTWMQYLMAGLVYGMNPEFLPDSLVQDLVPDVHLKKQFKRYFKYNIFKSHHCPRPEYQKVIYIVRDVRDVMLSYYEYNKNHPEQTSHTLDEMIMEGKGMSFGTWQEHVKKWVTNPFNSSILYIKYEELKSSPMDILKEICTFLNLDRTENVLKHLIEMTRFDTMKTRNEALGWEHPGIQGMAFMNKGKTGRYKEEMPKELQYILEKDCRKWLEYFNYPIQRKGEK